jgi:predicted MPP superfamily phosphohydrolase
MFHLVFAIPALYVMGRTIWPLPWLLGVKIAVAILVLLASQYHLYSRISSGSVFVAEMPRSAIIVFNWAFSTILLLTLFQLLADLCALTLLLLPGHSSAITPGLRYAMGAAAMVLAAVGVHAAIRVPPLQDVVAEIADLPQAFDGYTVLQLTDLHISPLFPAGWTQAVVNNANSLKADLVVVTGDLIDGTVAARARDIAPLAELRAADGVFVIPGNHEYFFDQPAWMRQFATLGMTILENSHTVVTRHGASLVLAGVTDLSAAETGLPMPDLAQALAGAPANVPVVLLDHQPKNARAAAAKGVVLQLSGHTHGGLVRGLGPIFKLANGGFVSGRYDVQGMTLYVNNGTALWPGLALRLGVPSELTRITLKRKKVGDIRQPTKDTA